MESQHPSRLLARMSSPLFLRPKVTSSPSASSSCCPLPDEPLQLALLRFGKYRPQQGLRKTVAELARRNGKLRDAVEAFEDAMSWAQREQATGGFSEFAADELVAIRLCSLQEPDFLLHMNRALVGYQPGVAMEEEAKHWEDFATAISSGLAKLRRSSATSSRTFRVVWVPQQAWEEHFEGREGSAVCFAGAQLAAAEEKWNFLTMLVQGCVPCVLEFDEVMVREAADIRSVSVGGGKEEEEVLLPPYAWGVIKAIRAEQAPEPFGMEVMRVVLQGKPSLSPLPNALEAPAESILAAALLVGLNTSLPDADSCLFSSVIGCFQALASAAEVKSLEAVQVVWKGYWECLLEGCHSWKELNETAFTGVVSAAKVAVVDLATAATGVTKRALKCESCMNHEAMEEMRSQLRDEVERLKEGAVAVARDQVSALQLETLTDPEAFLRFIQHDPVKAFEAASAAARAYLAAGPAQRVLLFAKLMGLAAMAGGLLGGDPKVNAAFDSPMPLQDDPWHVLLTAQGATHAEASAKKRQAAMQAVSCLQFQRMLLARTRLVIVGGAPDVGKTTFLREVFGFKHLVAGLSLPGRTEQMTFELHPDGDEQLCPVYMVDTPGFGDGECLYRNDMGRLLLGAHSWIPGGVTLIWVVRAGRNVRQEADEFLRSMAAPHSALLVVVTYIDKLFEERYREVGPQWRDGPLKGVPKNDPRWAKCRSSFMAELKEEVAAGVKSIVGGEQTPEMVYACLGGWMADDEVDDDDEFAARPPWPWAQEELTACFNIMSRKELKGWLDSKLGL
mmetsp:Transcript_31784/g.75455  ORF Transcript_31784/g.75455 Transcript_31784/m.75455 type:complete len:789 (+) Transcript_31784:90-2456(+)